MAKYVKGISTHFSLQTLETLDLLENYNHISSVNRYLLVDICFLAEW